MEEPAPFEAAALFKPCCSPVPQEALARLPEELLVLLFLVFYVVTCSLDPRPRLMALVRHWVWCILGLGPRPHSDW